MKRGRDRTKEYCEDVLSGKLIAGDLVRLACKRHLDDLEKSKLAPFRYYFDEKESDRILDFAETLVIAEGEEETPVVLYPFQCFILGNLNGWRDKTTGARRFRTSYVQLGRQNGKSFLNGILAAYYGNFDGYKYGQIYCAATEKEQARIVFNEICKFIEADEDLSACFRVHDHSSTIDCLITESTIRALSGKTKSIDGFRPLLGIVDEYHAHKTNQIYKLFEGGIKMMRSALISVITTAGFSLKSPCYRLYETCCNILRGVFTNDSQFVFIAELDEGDDERDPENWVKANPMLAYQPEALENLKPIAATAWAMGGDDLRDFLVKQLNRWVQTGSNKYIKDMAAWRRCGEKRQKLSDFAGKECYAGLDLSSGGDLTSLALVFPFVENGVRKYYIYAHSFIPARRLEEHIATDDAPYDIWEQQGLVTRTETLGGIKTDYKYIISHLKGLKETYSIKLKMVCYDPHNASAFLGDLEALGCDSLSVTQSARNLNDATVDLRLEIRAGNVLFDGDNEMLSWSMANAVTVTNSFKEIKLDKETDGDRIDAVDAVIDAWTMAMQGGSTVTTEDAVEDWLAFYGKTKTR